jgi:hypothetical protein
MMASEHKHPAWLSVLAVVLSVLGMAAMNAYFSGAFVPKQTQTAASTSDAKSDTPSPAGSHGRGNGSDLYPRWLGARELFLHGKDPYSPEVTAQIQNDVWGHVLDPNNPSDPKDQQRFAYPLYVVLLLAPFITLPFSTVQLLYVVFAAAGMVLSVRCWATLFGIRISGIFTAIACALLLGSHPVVTSLYMQQPVLFAAIAIAFAMAAITTGNLWGAGVLLALATIRPQSAVLVVMWLMFWAVMNWRARKVLVLSFAATMLVLCVVAEFLVSGWFTEWLEALAAYRKYTPVSPPHVQVLFGQTFGLAATAAILAGLAWMICKARGDDPSSDRFHWLSAGLLLAGLAMNPVWHSYDQIFEFPALLLLYHWRAELRRLPPVLWGVTFLALAAVASQWLTAAILAVMARVPGLAENYQWLWLPSLFSPLFVFGALAIVGYARLSVERSNS